MRRRKINAGTVFYAAYPKLSFANPPRSPMPQNRSLRLIHFLFPAAYSLRVSSFAVGPGFMGRARSIEAYLSSAPHISRRFSVAIKCESDSACSQTELVCSARRETVFPQPCLEKESASCARSSSTAATRYGSGQAIVTKVTATFGYFRATSGNF